MIEPTTRQPDTEAVTLAVVQERLRLLVIDFTESVKELKQVISELRTDHDLRLQRHEERIDRLEQRFDRQDGALELSRWTIATAFAAGGLAVGFVTLLLRVTGHL